MNDFFNLFASKRLLKIISEFLLFSLNSFFKYWFLSALIFISLAACIYFKFVTPFKIANPWLWLGLFIISSLPSFIILFKKKSKVRTNPNSINIAVSEPIIIYEKDHININIDSQKIAARQVALYELLSKNKYPFSIGLLNCVSIQKPKLYYLVNDLPSLKHKYLKLIKSEKVLSILLITRDIDNNKIEFEILFAENLKHAQPSVNTFKTIFNRTVEDDTQYDDYILEVTKVYLAVHGQSVLDMLINIEKFDYGHKVIDDCEQLFIQSINRISEIINLKSHIYFEEFKNGFLSNFERYRAIYYLNQREYNGAIRHLFKAIKIHPYFPYDNYVQYRDAYNKRYVAEVNLQTAQVNKESAVEGTSIIDDRSEEAILAFSDHLFERFEFSNMATFENVIGEIIKRAQSDYINKNIENELKKDFCVSPIKEIIRGEMLKYLPKGIEKHDELYLDRIPDVIAEFNKALEVDQDFTLMYTRIGMLKLIQSFHEKNTEREKQLFAEGIEYWQKGMDLFARLGVNIRSK